MKKLLFLFAFVLAIASCKPKTQPQVAVGNDAIDTTQHADSLHP